MTAEMVVRHLMSDLDKMEQIAVIAKTTGNAPRIYVSTNASPYIMAAGAAMLQDLALDGLNGHEKAPD
jgi:hypothetical protein